jgi:putative zinc finger/helix-turn-helix YgiT family protein
MKVARENYSYTASGLPYVTLRGIEIRRCPQCGEHEAVIPRLEELHRTIAEAVSEKPARLAPAEIRFLRKYLGWSGADFAKHMGVTKESVSRWENGHEPMGPTADRLLRLMVATIAPVKDYPIDTLANLDDSYEPIRLRMQPAKSGWEAEALSA